MLKRKTILGFNPFIQAAVESRKAKRKTKKIGLVQRRIAGELQVHPDREIEREKGRRTLRALRHTNGKKRWILKRLERVGKVLQSTAFRAPVFRIDHRFAERNKYAPWGRGIGGGPVVKAKAA